MRFFDVCFDPFFFLVKWPLLIFTTNLLVDVVTCGQIILKNRHVIDENLKLNIAEMFSSKIRTTNNVTPSNVCHTVKHFFKKEEEGKYFNTSKKLSEWVMHLDDCPTCELYHQNQKGINCF